MQIRSFNNNRASSQATSRSVHGSGYQLHKFTLTGRPGAAHIELSALSADETFNGICFLGLDRKNRDAPRHILYQLEQLLRAVEG